MIIGYIILAGEDSPKQYVNDVISQFNYYDQNVICLHNEETNHTFEIQPESRVREILDDFDSNVETILNKYLKYKTPIFEEQQRLAAEEEANYTGEA